MLKNWNFRTSNILLVTIFGFSVKFYPYTVIRSPVAVVTMIKSWVERTRPNHGEYRDGEKKSVHFFKNCSFSEFIRDFSTCWSSLKPSGDILLEYIYIHHIKYNIGYFSAKIAGELPVLLCMKKIQRKIAENVLKMCRNVPKHMFSENSDSYEFNEPKIIKKSHWTCENKSIEKTSIFIFILMKMQ